MLERILEDVNTPLNPNATWVTIKKKKSIEV